MGCFTNQISSEWLDIVIVSMRWAVNFFLNLKVIKGSSSYAIREIVTCLSSQGSLGYLVIFFSTIEVLYQETEALSFDKPSQLP